jgi:pilus assembly protein CpaF
MTDKDQVSQVDLDKLRDFITRAVKNEIEVKPPPADRYQQVAAGLVEKAFAGTKVELPEKERNALFREVMADLTGYGPIQPLLADPDISEIMVNGAELVFIEKHGKLIETPIKFENNDHVLRIIDRILHPLGLRVDYEYPTADARLPDGSRVNVVIPPVAHQGACITIRKFLRNKLTLNDLVELGSLTPHMAEFLEACVVSRLNIIVSGNTSSGKTTMLNVLTNFIPDDERIVTIEDAAELQLVQRHWISLETRPAGVDGKGGVGTRELVRNVLRMRPDRIVVGEVRSGESLDMLQAMNTGHDGSLTTLHANSPRDVISRLETMALMAGIDLPVIAIRQQIASAIDLIVHMARLPDGTRKTTRITEVAGMEGNVVTLTDIFEFEQREVDREGKIQGELVPTGIRPVFTPKLEVSGYKLGGDIFGAGVTKFNA